jgi:hypothetical protein
MTCRQYFALPVSFVVCLIVLVSTTESAEPDEAALFREKIEPILKSHCYECHSGSAEKVQSGLYVDSRAGLLRGGDSGPAVIRGKSLASPLIQAIRHEGGLAMPWKKPKLSDSTIADFVTWVEMKSSDPRERPASDDAESGLNEARRHWAFQPIAKAAPAKVNHAEWNQSPTDASILAKLEERQWQPSPPATRAELMRRLSFDLIGLPPTPEEIDESINDQRPDAIPRIVDRLLSSPHFAERAAMPWLDVVRFAETEGYEYDRHIPDAWRYRDFVIDSLNADKPFDPQNPECQDGVDISPTWSREA